MLKNFEFSLSLLSASQLHYSQDPWHIRVQIEMNFASIIKGKNGTVYTVLGPFTCEMSEKKRERTNSCYKKKLQHDVALDFGTLIRELTIDTVAIFASRPCLLSFSLATFSKINAENGGCALNPQSMHLFFRN